MTAHEEAGAAEYYSLRVLDAILGLLVKMTFHCKWIRSEELQSARLLQRCRNGGAHLVLSEVRKHSWMGFQAVAWPPRFRAH